MNKETRDKALNFEDEFYERLNELRGELKQEAIADRTHCSRQSVSNYINGKRTPDAQFVWDFLHLANEEYNEMGYGDINANYLFGLSDSVLYEDERIESVCKFSNETILSLKNLSKSPHLLRTLDIILQNKALTDFLVKFNHYVFLERDLSDPKFTSYKNKELLEFHLSKLTNALVLEIVKDIDAHDIIVKTYHQIQNDIKACNRFINGEIRSIDDVTNSYERALLTRFNRGGIDLIKQELERYEEELEKLKKKNLKNLKRIYNDRYNIKIDSN